MTTYSGRSANYIPGKEVVNKEPPVSKYVVEKLYRVHRERVLTCESTIDSHVKIPEFLTNQSWKKNAEKARLNNISKENQDIFDRISKVETNESLITKTNRVHVKRVEAKLSYLKKLKEHGRLVNMIKIQKENEYLLKRLEKAKPQYTLKQCKEWYKHHELYKAGRRSDPTAGHLMYGMKGLLPGTLPPLPSTLTSVLDTSDTITTLTRDHHKPLPGIERPKTEPNSSSSPPPPNLGSLAQRSITSSSLLSSTGQDSTQLQVRQSFVEKKFKGNNGTKLNHDKTEYHNHYTKDRFEDDDNFSGISEAASEKSLHFLHEHKPSSRPNSGSTISEVRENHSISSVGDDFILLAARPFTLPFDSKSCLVQVLSSRVYDENLKLRILSTGITQQLLQERVISIDKAYEITNAGGHSSQIVHSTDNEDLQSLSALLINMFKEADDDGSGSLTFDEFQNLMEQVELGISPQELRFVISEADENENGVVDYEEFVPLAVDLIQSFRARNRAKTINSQEDVMVDDQILKTISATELQDVADSCLQKIFEFDSKKYGLIRVPELKKILNTNALNSGLRENEINMLCQMLPRDQFGRIKYNPTPNTFYDTLCKVRFMTMKNTIVESRGSGLQKYLLDLCKEEERKLQDFDGEGMTNNSSSHDLRSMTSPDKSKEKSNFTPTGILPCRALMNILSNSPRLSLSRLQVLVIMSEASVLDGMINYFQFIPVVSKAIELMFEPKALRQRAELIEKTDLSPEALLQGMSSEMFEQRLLTLFKSYDIDHNGTLDQNEFIACLESLDLQLSYGEMVALMAAADVAQSGFLKFEEFVGFFTHNLLNLEREKHIRLLQTTITSQGIGSDGPTIIDNIETKKNKDPDLLSRLLTIFRLSDPENTGFITHEDFQVIIQNFSANVSKFLTDILLSELHVNGDGMVEYVQSLSTCADLLKVFRAKESALEEHKRREAQAEQRANEIVEAAKEELNSIVKYLSRKFKNIAESFNDPMSRFIETQEAVKSTNSGLSKNEANIVISKLFNGMVSVSSGKSFVARTSSTDDGSSSPSKMTQPASPGASSPHHSSDSPVVTRASHQFKQNVKSLKFQFSSQELYSAVFEARKNTIMRSLLQQVDSTSTQQLILKHFLDIIDKKKLENSDIVNNPQEMNYLPINVCFSVLENLPELHLNRAQIMFIISLSECYDKDGTALEIYKFSEHAALIVEHLLNGEVMETRTKLINDGQINESKLLNDLKEDSLVDYLTYSFYTLLSKKYMTQAHIFKPYLDSNSYLQETESYNNSGHHYLAVARTRSGSRMYRILSTDKEEDDEHGIENETIKNTAQNSGGTDKHRPNLIELEANQMYILTREQCWNVLKEIPKLRLSEREISTLLAGMPFNEQMNLVWNHEIISLIVESIKSLNREQMIHRRVSLVALSMPELQEVQNHMNEGKGSIPNTGRSSISVSITHQTKKLVENSIIQLKQLGEKILNFVKVQTQNDNVVIILPIDSTNRRSSQVLLDENISKLNQDHEIVQLFRGALFIPKIIRTELPKAKAKGVPPINTQLKKGLSTKEIGSNSNSNTSSTPTTPAGTARSRPSSTTNTSVAASSLASLMPEPTETIHELLERTNLKTPVLLQILAMEDTQYYTGCTLIVNLISTDGKVSCCEQLPVKLPSIGAVDREAAQQYANNLVYRMYFEEIISADYGNELFEEDDSMPPSNITLKIID